MNAADPLAQLKDIHLPPPVAAWPPAPGWWLLAALALLTLIALTIWLWRSWRQRAYRRAALRELAQLRAQWQQSRDDAQLHHQINALLKRVALHAYARERVAALHGTPWREFLDAQLRKPAFAAIAVDDFAQYRADAAPAPAEPLLNAARTWIRRHRC